ncbi:MAG: hypothetical protein R2697_00605 [Ilumatobacteraceae bacterium]
MAIIITAAAVNLVGDWVSERWTRSGTDVNALDVHDLSVHHRNDTDRRITTGVSFTVPTGGSLAIVGESVRSLTAKALIGLLPAQPGRQRHRDRVRAAH